MPKMSPLLGVAGGKNQWNFDTEILQHVWKVQRIRYFKIKIEESGIFIFEVLGAHFESH